MNIRIRIFGWTLIQACLLLLAIDSTAQAVPQKESRSGLEKDPVSKTISAEEKLIRFAYRKLEVYNLVSNYRDGVPLQEIRKEGKSIKLNLTNFKTGSIEDIKQRLYLKVVTLPTHEVIQLVQQSIQMSEMEPQVAYRAAWRAGQHATIFDRNWTVGDLLKIEVQKYYDVTRYASYDVAVSLGKKTRSYSAMVLFHGPVEDLRLEFWDSVVGMGGAISAVWDEQRVPYGLRRRDNRREGLDAREAFMTKMRAYLKRDPSSIRSSDPLECQADSEGIDGCCLDGDLAEFWETDPCEGWKNDVRMLPEDSVDSLQTRDIEFYSSDDTGHISGTGVHHGRARFRPSCTELPYNRQRCNVEVRDQGYGDTETNHSDIYYHRGTTAETSRGNEGPRGQNVECEAAVGFAFDYCFFSSCNVSMTLSVTGQGMGASATVTGGNLWRAARAQGNVCNIPSSTAPPGGCNESAENGCMPGFIAVGGTCTRSPAFMQQCTRFGDYDFDSCACTGGCDGACSPIIVDVLGNGFSMTNASTGVFFDMEGKGTVDRFSWTAARSDDAWLALDRNNNGLIDSGKELFGNITAQDLHREGVERNGFLALALYDSPAYGGNGDGFITRNDSIYSRLKLWRDENHNGVSEDCELFALQDLGLEKIDLNYGSSRRVDEHGNQFKFRSKVHDSQGSNLGRWAWDVFLVGQP